MESQQEIKTTLYPVVVVFHYPVRIDGVMHPRAVMVQFEFDRPRPCGFDMRTRASVWASTQPGGCKFDSSGFSVWDVRVVPDTADSVIPRMTEEEYLQALQRVCTESLRLTALWEAQRTQRVQPSKAAGEWADVPEDRIPGAVAFFRTGKNTRNHGIYLRQPEAEGTHYTSSFGPNSDDSYSGFLPGADTLEKAKERVYDRWWAQTSQSGEARDYAKHTKQEFHDFAWKHQKDQL